MMNSSTLKSPRRASSLAYLLLALSFAALVRPVIGLPVVGSRAGSVAGRVKPTHDHDLVLATAAIPDLALKVEVAADGSFHFPAVRPGAYLLEVRIPSLGTAVERLEVRAGEETVIEIKLKPGSHFEEIVVSASANARDPLELAAPVTSLSGQALALRSQSSLGETLSGEPGISSTFFGPGASRPIIRGLGGDRVRMLEGGIGTGDASGVSADHAVATDPGSAERIEVVRGPATLLYGSSAVGGVINVIDQRIPSSRSTGLHGGVELRAGTVSDERLGSAKLDGGRGSWAWHADLIARQADDYKIPGAARLGRNGAEEPPFGSVPNTDLDSQGGRLGMTRFFGDRGFAGVALSSFDSSYGLPGRSAPGAGEETVRIDMQQRRFDLRAQLKQPCTGFEGLKVRLGITDYEHVELEGDREGTFFFNDSVEARLELVQQARVAVGGRRYSGSFGLHFTDSDFEAIGDEAFLPRTTTERWALFVLQEIDSGPLTWQFGGRFEQQDAKPTAASLLPARSQDGLSASLGLVWRTNEVFSLALSASRSIKLAAAEELYSRGLHAATQTFEIGDPRLTKEVGLGLDLSFRVETERGSGELTLFRQNFDDFIFQAFTGAVEEGLPVVLFSQADARFSGAEMKARLELWERDQHHLHLELVGDLVDAELDRGGNLPRIPPLRLGGSLHYHSELWNATAEVRWVDSQTAVAENEDPSRGYTSLNASLGYRLVLRQQIVDLLLRGRNLSDQQARSHTSLLKNVAPLPGRDLSLMLKWSF